VSAGVVALMVLAALVAMAAALLVSDVGGVYTSLVGDTWDGFVSWIKGLVQT
jgi:uncharacterized membrane-anchored protein